MTELPATLRAYLLEISAIVPRPSESIVRAALERGGWNEEEISASLSMLAATATSHASGLGSVQKLPGALRIGIPSGSNESTKNVGPGSALTAPVPITPGRKKALMCVLLGSFLLLLLFAAAMYAYSERLFVFDRPPYSATELFDKMFERIAKTGSAAYSIEVAVGTEQRLTGVIHPAPPWRAGYIMPESWDEIPPDIDFTLRASGVFDIGTSPPAGEASLQFEGVWGGRTYAGKIDLAESEEVYLRVGSFSEHLLDLSNITGSWIKTGPMTEVPSVQYVTKLSQRGAETLVMLSEGFLKRIGGIGTFIKQNAIKVKGGAIRGEFEGIPAYRYDLEFQNGYLRYDESALFVDRKGVPIAFRFVGRTSPSGALWTERDITVVGTLRLHDVGKARPVSLPMEFTNVEEALFMLSGLSRGEYFFDLQSRAIEDIRAALQSFMELKGSYPSTLEELRNTASEITDDKKRLEDTYTGKAYRDQPLLDDVPRDVYTREAFSYFAKEKDYTLEYMILLPEYKGGSLSPYFTVEYAGKKERLEAKYVSGVNTATSGTLSKEAAVASRRDGDKDGVPDVLESYAGTDPAKADTDADGTSDLREIRASDLETKEL